ncbi:uncharacterized protein LOC133302306 [Gastrolobium bilobum]|uniref:uncharacterized protein LOC133302306 n=1 Tax=Gastrolobium bilobum TaxID=150636 RepID=UPI002AB03E5C|nr:uncharacterized protein LOC133302306 [Gastrolobium bilobum]
MVQLIRSIREWREKDQEDISPLLGWSFAWLVMHRRILTKERTSNWGGDKHCHNCTNVTEDGLHVLTDCRMVVHVWKACNEIHDPLFRRPSNSILALSSYISEFNTARTTPSLQSAPSSSSGQTSWRPPGPGWWKLNVDGAVKTNHRVASCGGLVRDDKGGQITGFSYYIRSCSPLMAELWPIMKGLQIA